MPTATQRRWAAHREHRALRRQRHGHDDNAAGGAAAMIMSTMSAQPRHTDQARGVGAPTNQGGIANPAVADACGGRVELVAVSADWSMTTTHLFAFGVTVDELSMTGWAVLALRPTEQAMIASSTGALRVEDARGEVDVCAGTPVLTQPGRRRIVWSSGGVLRLTSIDTTLLRTVRDSRRGDSAWSAQLSEVVSADSGLMGLWDRCVSAVSEILHAPDPPAPVTEVCARLLAAAALVCFPGTTFDESVQAVDPKASEQVRRAIAFLEENILHDACVRELADAMHLSPRAVQYLFRKRLSATPTEYLRRLRLHAAHRDLIAADRTTVTVAQIAQRWRFGHTGRFAGWYRQVYGESPRTTLQAK